MRAKWTCQFWFPEDHFGTRERILRPKGIVEGQRERETAIVLGILVWIGGGQPVDIGASIALMPWAIMAVHGKVVRTKRGFAFSGFFVATVDCLANNEARCHSITQSGTRDDHQRAHMDRRDCFEIAVLGNA